jgi:hypothetical protein
MRIRCARDDDAWLQPLEPLRNGDGQDGVAKSLFQRVELGVTDQHGDGEDVVVEADYRIVGA